MEYDIHTVLDLLTLVATLWVIYELRFPLADTYQKDQDTIQSYYVVRIRPARPSCSACVTVGFQGCTWQWLCPTQRWLQKHLQGPELAFCMVIEAVSRH